MSRVGCHGDYLPELLEAYESQSLIGVTIKGKRLVPTGNWKAPKNSAEAELVKQTGPGGWGTFLEPPTNPSRDNNLTVRAKNERYAVNVMCRRSRFAYSNKRFLGAAAFMRGQNLSVPLQVPMCPYEKMLVTRCEVGVSVGSEL